MNLKKQLQQIQYPTDITTSKVPTADKNLKALTITVILAIVFGAYFLRRYFLLIVISAVLVYLFNPFNKGLLRRGKKPATAAVLTFLFMMVVLLVPLTIVLIATIAQVKGLVTSAANAPVPNLTELGQSALNTINHLITKVPGVNPLTQGQLHDTIATALQTIGKNMVNILSGTIASIPGLVARGILFIYVFLALMIHQDKVLETLQRLNPLGRKIGRMYLDKAGAMTKAMAKGQFVIALLDGLTGSILMYIVGFHNIFFFMLIILTFLSFIPLGGGIIVIPVGVVLIFTGHIWQGLLLIIGHIFITSNIDNVLRPHFVPKSAHLQPALTMLSVFAGVAMFGILGVIVGPIIMILITSTIDVYLETSATQNAGTD